MSDLFKNHIVGFPTRRLMCCSDSSIIEEVFCAIIFHHFGMNWKFVVVSFILYHRAKDSHQKLM